MYTYHKQEVNGEQLWVVADKNWRHVRDTILDGMTNFGIPIIDVEDGDYLRRGELLLTHAYDGKPLDADYSARTLRYIAQIWGRPVHIRTVADDKPVLFTHDGEEFNQEPLTS
jgi:stage V sporulation protein R